MGWAFLAHYFQQTTCGSFSLVPSTKEHRGIDLISDMQTLAPVKF